MDKFSLKNKTAFVSGSYQGLGYAVASALGLAGARVIINGRNRDKVDEAVKALKKQGLEAFGYAFDITKKEQVEINAKTIEKDMGPIDILVNNAGRQCRAPLEELALEKWLSVLELNLTAVFLLSQAFIKGMIRRKKGKIINIASLMSFITRPTTGPYSASKGGLVMLTKSMAVEWAKYNIQANAIAPGYFHTEMTDKLVKDPEFNKWITSRTPAGRWGTPQDLAGIAVFLASEASNFINGQCIIVDGGLSAAI